MNDTPNHIKYIVMCCLGILFSCYISFAQDKPKSEWQEIKAVELPQGLEVYSGITSGGNPKYWIEIQKIKVFLTPTNKEHYLNNTCTIMLVEWYNKSKDVYKYTTRQKKEVKQTKINLNAL